MFDPCRLENRAVIRLSGPDAIQFLHDLTTGPVAQLSDGQAAATLLLNSRGRIIFDLVVYRNGDGLILDSDGERIDNLIQMLGMYRLRREVEIRRQDDMSIIVSPEQTENTICFADPRRTEIGFRQYVESDDLDYGNPAGYHEHRLSIGVAEGAGEIRIERDAALECNYDQLGAIDWDKGCYMGQELTASLYHRSLLKKRLVPVTGDGNGDAGKIYADGKVVGDLRNMVNGHGIAMINISAMRDQSSFQLGEDGQRQIKIKIPDWLDIEHKARK
jgi:hypothetical protein